PGPTRAGRGRGVERQAELAHDGWGRQGAGALGGALAQASHLRGGVEDAGSQAPEGGQDQATEQAAQAERVMYAAGFEVPAVGLPTEEEALDAPAAGVFQQAGLGGPEASDQQPRFGGAWCPG